MTPITISDHAIGVTPILIKRAAYYVALGLGEYVPNHPHYDRVVVSKIYDVAPNPDNPFEWSLGLVVTFYKDNRRVRWVDFSCRLTGAGGDTILKEVLNNE